MIDNVIKNFDNSMKRRRETNDLEPRFMGKLSMLFEGQDRLLDCWKSANNKKPSFNVFLNRQSIRSVYIVVSGRVHGKLRPYGFIGNHWEKLGETIIDVVLAQEAVRDLPGAGQAWVLFTACLVDQVSFPLPVSFNCLCRFQLSGTTFY